MKTKTVEQIEAQLRAAKQRAESLAITARYSEDEACQFDYALAKQRVERLQRVLDRLYLHS